ncbi:VOC family protein [Jeongeupia sp. USM3]|uniref:VOC family protein n=1 Tax=Jeongeupia sp. USM3 TaxID=1906741 RepID=UPI00089DE05D|nr:VOC family protein [Jeongeupia sp. USM3]AOY01620.1 glyoxalase [Jeongeupia sp. USM3]
MIDHVGITVSNFEQSKSFYASALSPIGYVLLMDLPKAVSGSKDFAGFGALPKPDFWIGGNAADIQPVHVAFSAPDRAQVRAFYAAAIAAGGRDNGAPGIRAHYHPDYYSAFVLDPDGHNVEVVCHAPAASD